MEKEIQISFFKRIKMSIFDFDKYHIMASEGIGRAMMYLVKLILLFSLIITAASMLKISQLFEQVVTFFSDNVPNFHFEDNQFILESDNDYSIENHEYVDFKIILTNSEEYNEEEIKDFDGIVAVLTKNHLLFKQQNSTSITTQTYEEISNQIDLSQVNKEFVTNAVKGDKAYGIFMNILSILFITTFFSYFFTAIIDSLALALLGYIVSRIIRIPLKLTALYSLSISAITLPVIINAIYLVVNLFTGFVIPYFQIMYTLISYVYLIAALLIMRSEIIKKKVQIQIQIMNKNYNPEELQNQDKKNEKEQNKDEKDNSKDSGNKEEKDTNSKTPELKNNKDNPEPQANFKTDNN